MGKSAGLEVANFTRAKSEFKIADYDKIDTQRIIPFRMINSDPYTPTFTPIPIFSVAFSIGCDDAGCRNRQTVGRNAIPPDDGRIR